MSSAAQKVPCPACGRAFRWNAELAGCNVKCPCGQAFVFPFSEPGAEDVYDVVDEPQAPPPARVQPVLPKAEPVLEYAVPRRSGPTVQELVEGTPFKSLAIPIALGALALGFRVVLAFIAPGSSNAAALLTMVIALVISVVTMFAGVGLVARVMGTDLGSMPVAAVKLLATAIVGSLVFAGVTMVFRQDDSRGMVVALHAVFFIYWVMVSMWFELDMQESLMAVAIVVLLQSAMACVLWPH